MNYRQKVFLSGGFRSNWQQTVIDQCGERFIYFNPKRHGLEKSEEYTLWDVHFVKECDILFAFMEETNPSGYGLAFELGLAYALNKTIILVDEKSLIDQGFARYFKIVHKSSGVVLQSLEQGIHLLKSFAF
ncbi:hypothetical protein EON78_04845 [bacterium]|nr:MAG: hypothetical protein EON78_04845 [bacterium]